MALLCLMHLCFHETVHIIEKINHETTHEIAFCYQNCSSDWEKLLNLEAEGREFERILRSLEQFIQTVKVQNNFW